MQNIIRQLERVRGRAKRLLLGEALARWLAALLLAAAACMLIDYVLRLPGWVRLVVDVIVFASALRWLAHRLQYAFAFAPTLGELAQRAEKLYPQTRGVLASAVEFQTIGAGPTESSQLTEAAIREGEKRAGELKLMTLIDATRPVRALAVMMLVVIAFAAAAWAQPAHVALAAQRWLAPLGETEWPKRTNIQSMLANQVWPTDQPLRLVAWVDRGYKPGMRTAAVYRIVMADGSTGAWQQPLMNEQAEAGDPLSLHSRGRFEQLIDLPQQLAALPSGAQPRAVEVYFTAGDDRTQAQRITLVERPALVGVQLDVDPPRYAAGLISEQSVQMLGQSAQVATAAVRAGSNVTWRLELNKPLPPENLTLINLMPGITVDATVTQVEPTRVDVSMRAVVDVQTTINLVDEHGLGDLSERQYRVQTIVDQPPAATVTEPAVDEAVLASAVVGVAGVGQDDVAVQRVSLDATLPAPSASESEKTTSQIELAATAGRAARLTVQHTLELAPLELSPGDQIELTAVAQDVYDLDGRRHDPVRSTPRRLRIIDPTQLAGQLRSELAAVRQSAIRLEQQQQEIAEQPSDVAADAQQRLSRRLEAQVALLDGLSDRIERNRMESNDLKQLTDQARDLAAKASTSSADAQEQLKQAQRDAEQAPRRLEAAKRKQQDVNDKLVSLIDLLDQGQDALTLQLQLQQLAKMQEQLAADVRKTLPRTAGKTEGDLSNDDLRELKELADRQEGLSQRAGALAQQMQSTAEALDQPQASEKDQAAAEALAEAARIAQRQGLAHEMKQAAENTEQNKLAEASRQQSRSMDTMQQMLQQMGQQDRRRQEMLQRKLLELVEAIEKLVERQRTQLTRLDEAINLVGLDGPMGVLRRNTVDVAEQATASRATAQVADKLNEASSHQASAVTALRAERRDAAREAEDGSLALLTDALALVKQMQEAQQREQRRKQREELLEAYEKLAEQQDELRDKTAPFAEAERITRRQRAELINLGHAEADLRVAVKEAAQPDQPLLFEHMHGRIDTAAEDAVTTLRRGAVEGDVIDRQTSVSMMLRQLAAALERAQQEDDGFNEAGGGGGGGGGGQQQQQSLVPPEAELRLFRGLQESIYNRTRAIEDNNADDTQRRKALQNLAVEQRELAGLGEQLIEQMQQQRSGQPQEVTP